MEFWVHWIEHREGQQPIFQMNRLKAVALHDDSSARKLRKMIHNILDWGCGARFNGFKRIYEKFSSKNEGQPNLVV